MVSALLLCGVEELEELVSFFIGDFEFDGGFSFEEDEFGGLGHFA